MVVGTDPENRRMIVIGKTREKKNQGYHSICRANYRCCIPALAGFVSPQSMGPGRTIKGQLLTRFKLYY